MIIEPGVVPGSTKRLLSIEECRPELQALYALWQKIRGDRLMPARQDFDPADIPQLLPYLFLIDVFSEKPREQRFRVRLQGTAQAAYHGVDWTGSYVQEMIDPASAERFWDLGDHIIASREPWMSTGKLYWIPSKPYYDFETVILPLSDNDSVVNMLLGLTKLI